jgi:hypothetical protein
MPDPLVPDVGELRLLELIKSAGATFAMGLFKANYTVTLTTVLTDVTGSGVEADYASYARQSPTFGTAATDGSGRGYIDSDVIVFPLAGSGTQTVYGWFLLDSGGNLIQAKNFTSPITVSTSVTVDPFIHRFLLWQPDPHFPP